MNRETVRLINAATQDLSDYFHENQAALDRIQLAKLKSDLMTMMKRHGRGRIIGLCVDAIRDAERDGAKW